MGKPLVRQDSRRERKGDGKGKDLTGSLGLVGLGFEVNIVLGGSGVLATVPAHGSLGREAALLGIPMAVLGEAVHLLVAVPAEPGGTLLALVALATTGSRRPTRTTAATAVTLVHDPITVGIFVDEARRIAAGQILPVLVIVFRPTASGNLFSALLDIVLIAVSITVVVTALAAILGPPTIRENPHPRETSFSLWDVPSCHCG